MSAAGQALAALALSSWAGFILWLVFRKEYLMRPARPGDKFEFTYPNEPQFSTSLVVVRVLGDGPDDLVFFDDGTHSKQKDLVEVPRAQDAAGESS